MNLPAIRAIYKFEMARWGRTFLQSIVSPVIATSLYFAPNFKAPAVMSLPMNAALRIKGTTGAFGRLADGRFVPLQHIAEPASPARDFVSIAETFAGVPYVWGGKTLQGVDCSGLLQVALQAAGIACPRDSDMQEAELGVPVPRSDDLGGLVRGDLVFCDAEGGMLNRDRVKRPLARTCREAGLRDVG